MAPKRKQAVPSKKKTDKSVKKARIDKESNSAVTTNFKIISWNVSGLRAWLKKDGLSIVDKEEPDIICLQETKCSETKMPEEVKNLKGYKTYFAQAKKEGYSGVALFSKDEPISLYNGINATQHDDEGRCITAEYEKFYVVTAYVPNSGKKLVTLDKRMDWDQKLKTYLTELDKKKPVIYCGDLNVSHNEIDLANPKSNKRNAGFTQEERDGFTDLLAEGFVDSFRHLYPDKEGQYTFWSYMMNARAKNLGWRLDYFVLSEKLLEKLQDNVIHSSVLGSDHCPIALTLKT